MERSRMSKQRSFDTNKMHQSPEQLKAGSHGPWSPVKLQRGATFPSANVLNVCFIHFVLQWQPWCFSQCSCGNYRKRWKSCTTKKLNDCKYRKTCKSKNTCTAFIFLNSFYWYSRLDLGPDKTVWCFTSWTPVSFHLDMWTTSFKLQISEKLLHRRIKERLQHGLVSAGLKVGLHQDQQETFNGCWWIEQL